MTRLPKLVLGVLALAATAASSSCMYKQVEAPQAAARTPDEQRIIGDFKKRVDRYEDASERLKKQVYPATQELNPEQIHTWQKELAARIIQQFPSWKQGEIFTPEISALFKQRIAQVVNDGAEGANVKGAIFDDAPGDMAITVFTEYPSGAPIATLPAQLLKVFPALPREVEYRFLGPNLILMDVAAFLIVDVIPDAIK